MRITGIGFPSSVELNSRFSRRSSITIPSPLRSKESLEPPAPALFSAVLRQHSERSTSSNNDGLVLIFMLVWLLRNEIGDEYESLLNKLSRLAPLADIQVRVSLEI